MRDISGDEQRSYRLQILPARRFADSPSPGRAPNIRATRPARVPPRGPPGSRTGPAYPCGMAVAQMNKN